MEIFVTPFNSHEINHTLQLSVWRSSYTCRNTTHAPAWELPSATTTTVRSPGQRKARASCSPPLPAFILTEFTRRDDLQMLKVHICSSSSMLLICISILLQEKMSISHRDLFAKLKIDIVDFSLDV